MINYALIGVGRISPNHIQAAKNNNLNIVALCDLDEKKSLNRIKEFNLTETKSYRDYKKMIHKEKIDLVAIATESGKHAEIAKYCIKKGINLIIEKPVAMSLEDIDELIKLQSEYGVIVSSCHQNRFNKAIQKTRDAVENGSFGKLFYGTAHVRWNRGIEYYKQDDWRGTWKLDGGALMNQCIHNIDLLRWMMGDGIEEVFAYTDNLNHPYIEAEDLGVALIKFKNGAYGVVEGTTNIFPSNLEETLYLFGEKGTVKVGGKSVNFIEEWLFLGDLDESDEVKKKHFENPENVYGFGHTPLYADVKEAIKKKKEPYITLYDGRNAVELILAIYESAFSGDKVKLPLKSGSTIKYEGRFK